MLRMKRDVLNALHLMLNVLLLFFAPANTKPQAKN